MRLNYEQQIALATRIKERRTSKDLSQEKLGSYCEVTKQMISNLENSKYKTISIGLLIKLAENLSCTEDYLLGNTHLSYITANSIIHPAEFLPGKSIRDKIYTATDADLEVYNMLMQVLEKNKDNEKRDLLKKLLTAFL